jgi:hypothetical protein
MPRQFGAGETVVLTDHTMLQTGYVFPPSCTRHKEETMRTFARGLHFEFSNQDGLAAGRAVAAEILAHSLLRKDGSTHFGQCPVPDRHNY